MLGAFVQGCRREKCLHPKAQWIPLCGYHFGTLPALDCFSQLSLYSYSIWHSVAKQPHDDKSGISFDPVSLAISGTPTATAAAASYTLTATEFDTSNPDTDLVSFEMKVLDGDTELEITGLAPPIYEGQQFTFTVAGSNIPTISS